MLPDASSPFFPAVLAAYIQSGQVQAACDQVEVHRTTHYHWLQTDPAYAEAFAAARHMAGEVLEAEATRRALGWDERHYRPDGTPYTVWRHSDTLLIFLLKGLFPDRYRDSARRDESRDISELLKAVLLEMHERSQARDVTPEADWAPVPPGERPTKGTRPPLPAPPGLDDEEPR
jgi:hypothetical protein